VGKRVLAHDALAPPGWLVSFRPTTQRRGVVDTAHAIARSTRNAIDELHLRRLPCGRRRSAVRQLESLRGNCQ